MQLSGKINLNPRILHLCISDVWRVFIFKLKFKLSTKVTAKINEGLQTAGCCNGTKMAASLPVAAWPNTIYGSAPKALLSPPNLALPCLCPFLPHALCSPRLFPSLLCVVWSFLISGACKVHPFVRYSPSWIVYTQFLFTILSGFECRFTELETCVLQDLFEM